MKNQIEQKVKQLNNLVYSLSNLEKRVTSFYDGWLQFINQLEDNTELKTANEAVYNTPQNSDHWLS